MSDSPLRDLVLKRLEGDATPENEWWPLVLAALDGEQPLAELLDQPSDRDGVVMTPCWRAGAEAVSLGLDVPGALPRAEGPLPGNEWEHDPLQLDDESHLLG